MAAKSFSLPPSIGYLFAGFLLHFLGFQADDSIYTLANLGITLMLFTIGLKLNVKDLIKKEVWLGTLSHSIVWLILGVLLLKLFAVAAISYFSDLSFYTISLIIFALSFSSTCTVRGR